MDLKVSMTSIQFIENYWISRCSFHLSFHHSILVCCCFQPRTIFRPNIFTISDQSISTKRFSHFFIKLSALSSSFFIELRIRRMKMQFTHPTLLFWKNQRQYKRNSSLHSCNLYINLSALIFFLAPDICFSWSRGTFSNQMGTSL